MKHRLLWGLSLAPLLALTPLALPTAQAVWAAPPARKPKPEAKAKAPPAPAVDRKGSILPRYNFPAASRGDRFARRGLNLKVGIQGWRRYGKVVKRVASEHRIDPFVLGAYVWVESEFDAGQDYTNGRRRALGLGSVQATDFPQYPVAKLKEPYLNLTLTAREFKHKWAPHDMAGTVMDVWYPSWRRLHARGEHIPVIKSPGVYVQAIANRYYALQDIDLHLRPRTPETK